METKNIERLLETLISEIRDLKDEVKTIKEELDWTKKTTFAGQMNDVLDWTKKYSFANKVVESLGNIEVK